MESMLDTITGASIITNATTMVAPLLTIAVLAVGTGFGFRVLSKGVKLFKKA